MHYGAISLKEGISSTIDTLDRTFPTKIAEVKCTLHPPVISDANSSTSSNNVRSPFANLWPDINWWGHHYTGESEITIKTFGVAVDDNYPMSALADIAKDLRTWGTRLVGWLSVLADGPTELIGDHHTEIVWEDLVPAGASGWMYFGSSNTVTNPRAVTADQWAHALLQSGNKVDAPLYRVLLVETQRAIATSRWRSAIVDAATATEVALLESLTQTLAHSAPTTTVEAMMKRIRMLGPLVSFARDVGLVVPTNIQTDLIETRNRVMHRGDPANREDAEKAYLVARDTINGLLPLSQLGQQT